MKRFRFSLRKKKSSIYVVNLNRKCVNKESEVLSVTESRRKNSTITEVVTRKTCSANAVERGNLSEFLFFSEFPTPIHLHIAKSELSERREISCSSAACSFWPESNEKKSSLAFTLDQKISPSSLICSIFVRLIMLSHVRKILVIFLDEHYDNSQWCDGMRKLSVSKNSRAMIFARESTQYTAKGATGRNSRENCSSSSPKVWQRKSISNSGLATNRDYREGESLSF